MPRYLTDQKVAEIPCLQPLDDAGRLQVLADANVVYVQVRANEFVTDTDLRAWGEQNSLDPDRMNLALAFLDQTDQLTSIPDDPPPIVPPPDTPPA